MCIWGLSLWRCAGSGHRDFHRLASAQPAKSGSAPGGGGGGAGSGAGAGGGSAGGGGDREGPGGEGGGRVLTPKNVQVGAHQGPPAAAAACGHCAPYLLPAGQLRAAGSWPGTLTQHVAVVAVRRDLRFIALPLVQLPTWALCSSIRCFTRRAALPRAGAAHAVQRGAPPGAGAGAQLAARAGDAGRAGPHPALPAHHHAGAPPPAHVLEFVQGGDGHTPCEQIILGLAVSRSSG